MAVRWEGQSRICFVRSCQKARGLPLLVKPWRLMKRGTFLPSATHQQRCNGVIVARCAMALNLAVAPLLHGKVVACPPSHWSVRQESTLSVC